MNTRTRSTRNTPDAATAVEQAMHALPSAGREQLAAATEAACVMFRGFEAMRKIQHTAAHQAARHHEAVAQKLQGSPAEPGELLAIEADLLRFDMESAVQYWQQLWATAFDMQAKMMACGRPLVDPKALMETAASAAPFASQFAALNGFFGGDTAREPQQHA